MRIFYVDAEDKETMISDPFKAAHNPVPDSVKSILIVEDDPDNVAFLTLALQELTPYLPLKVQTGLEAAESAETMLFDLLILDYKVPYINGFQAYDIICNITRQSRIPAILITAQSH